MRSQSTTVKMPQEEYEHLLHNRQSSSIAWENLTTNDCTINDLDKTRIRSIVHVAITAGRLTAQATRASIVNTLNKLDLMVGNKLTNAAVILFCKKENKQFIQSNVKLARFKGIDKSEFIDNRVQRGNVFDLYESTMAFLNSYIPVAGKIEEGNPFRVDTPAVSYNVLREAIINALAHRDYSNRGGSVHVAIYDDRVEIDSTGRLPSGIKLSDLTKIHKSHPRNPLIANVFFICRMIELWGRGTLDMIKISKQAGYPTPQFKESTGSFSVILPLKEPIARVSQERKTIAQLSDRQKEILAILKKGPMSREQIMGFMKKPPTSRMVQIELSNLKNLGMINTEGKGKGRFVKWVLVR